LFLLFIVSSIFGSVTFQGPTGAQEVWLEIWNAFVDMKEPLQALDAN
jgi:hypothetical protein